ncbi:conserved hypothetical protein [Candidatus Desulfarcum epimagneticum]|uniref:Schlafen AlbA-2 domain-containing protein n=1 Tax=uncultured Desulfobacteraceae bacterium TaxID=218296 RepID=A0A484HCK0_9BACT|nr:conserved hypothetical protein [uncultured Desulfobacteraceae bacterium]
MKWSAEKVREAVRNGENSFVEFKTLPVRPESVAKELTAFSNFKGGVIFLGVSDDGAIAGANQENLEEWAMNIASDLVEPVVIPSYQEVKMDSGTVAVVEVDSGVSKPYALKKGPHRTYYIRVGSTSRIVDRDQWPRLSRPD